MNALCAEIGEKCTIEEVAWDGIIPALTSKKFDAILSSMSVTDERKKTISFSDIYYNSAAVIIGPKSDDKDFSPEHFQARISACRFPRRIHLSRQILWPQGGHYKDLRHAG